MPGRDLFAGEALPQRKGRDLFADEPADETEEFEFRLRAEREAAAGSASPTPTLADRIKGGAELGARMFSQNHPIIAGMGEAGMRAASQALASPIEAAASAYNLATARPGTKVSSANDAIARVADALTYQPRTAPGRVASEVTETLGSLIPTASERAGQFVTERTRPYVGDTASKALGVATDLVPQAAAGLIGGRIAEPSVRAGLETVARRGEESAAVRTAEQAPMNAKIERARELGIRLPPSEAGGIAGKVLEGVGGKTQTEMSLSRANSKVINRTVAKELGLDAKTPLTDATIERLKQAAYKPYESIRKAGRVTADDDYRAALERVKDRTQQAAEDFPEDTNELIEKEIAKFNKRSADAGSMLDKIKSLRERAGRNMKSLDAEKFELGLAQKKIATAMEDLIERRVGESQPALVKDFRAARQQLAKIYNVEDALGPNGNVSAAVLARQLNRGVPLSGGLRSVAEVYQEFPKIMRYVDDLGGHSPFSALDYLIGGVSALAHPGAIAMVAARPVSRAIVGSKPYQSAAIKPRVPQPSIASRAARRVAQSSPNTLAGLAGGVALTESQPAQGQVWP